MSSSTLSSRELVRLAHRSRLSLTLRAEWQRRVSDRDPLNSLRMRVWFLNMFYAVPAILGGVALILNVLSYDAHLTEYGSLLMRNCALYLGILGFGSFVATGLINGDGAFSQDGLQFKEEFCDFLRWGYPGQKMLEAAGSVAKATLENLKPIAKIILIEVAERILEHAGKKSDKVLVDATWSKVQSELDAEIDLKYKTLEHFGLVFGGYQFFFAEAKKRLEEKKAKADAEAKAKETADATKTITPPAIAAPAAA